MSPASSGTLEVGRYIGACLISSQQSRYKKHYVSNKEIVYLPRSGYIDSRFPRCSSGEIWPGGMPLISFVNNLPDSANPLTRLAVHTQGAPLILANNKYRKNKTRNNTTNITDIKKQGVSSKETSADTVSVASDESSANSDTCLPRIIKPRKRRKKDRKPQHLVRLLSQDCSFSTDSVSPDMDLINFPLPHMPYSPDAYDPILYNPYNIENNNTIGNISETPKLHHSFEDIEELDGTDINSNVESSCQCRYCDPSGQIWDIDRSCYSPFLTSPPFQFPDTPKRYSSAISEAQNQCLIDCITTFSIEDDNKSTTTSIPKPSRSSCDLEVSTEIITSLNGHRDIEIRFFSSTSSNNSDKSETAACHYLNKCPNYVSEE